MPLVVNVSHHISASYNTNTQERDEHLDVASKTTITMGSASGDRVFSTPTTISVNDDDEDPLSPYNPIHGTNPDFVLIWNDKLKGANSKEACIKRATFEDNLEEEGLILEHEVIEGLPHLHALKIWAPLETLKRYSEILKVRLPMRRLDDRPKCQLNESHSRHVLVGKSSSTVADLRLYWDNFMKLFSLDLDPDLFPEKCRKLTGVYTRNKEYLFDVDERNMYEIFPIAMRSRIVQYILKQTPYKTPEKLERDDFAFGYERLIQKEIYEAGYPLHDGDTTNRGSVRKLLCDHWGKLSICFKYQPLDTLRDYFGVNIALYFAWLGYYTGMLGFASIFGIACFIYGMASTVKDQYVNDVCNQTASITMCPICDDSLCPYWKISERCSYSKFAHLFDNDFTIAFALLMSVWTAVFLEYWKRYSAKITHRWDLTNFDVRDFTPRPEYVVELKKIYPKDEAAKHLAEDGDVKGRRYDFELTIPFWTKKLPFTVLSFSTVLLLVILALTALTGVILYRLWFIFWLSKGRSSDRDVARERIIVSFTAALINLSFIVIFGKVYEKIALKLTDMELPRTQAEFDASYTLKIYLLQFINNYSSVFYVAFFKGIYSGDPHKYHKFFGVLRQEECGISCMPELCIQLVVIMVGKQAKSMFMEAFLPWCKRELKRISTRLKKVTNFNNEVESEPQSRKASIKTTSRWIEDYDLLEWGPYLLTDEYLEMVLQFGFVTMFVTAFPLAPFFALLNNLFELRVDASKMLRHYRRPVGIRVKDIGVWSNIVDGLVKLAVLSNACIIALTSNFIPKLMYRYFLFDRNSRDYGTLNGYLNHSLTAYNTHDLDSRPSRDLSPPELVCHFPTYRNDYTSPNKYEYRIDHWKIWLARILFIIVYENIVAVLILVLRWMIPDIPSKLLKQMQREQRMINDLTMKHELRRSHKSGRRIHRGVSVHTALINQPEFENNRASFNSAGSASKGSME